MDDNLFSLAGKTSESGYVSFTFDFSDDNVYFDSLCDQGNMKTLFPAPIYYGENRVSLSSGQFFKMPYKQRMFCPVPSAQVSSDSAIQPFCKYKNMAVKARFRMTLVDYKNCPTSSCKFTKEQTTKSTIEVYGDLKLTGAFSSILGIEASVGGKMETAMEYKAGEEVNLVKDESAYLVGLTVTLETSVDSVSVSTYPSLDSTECKEDKYTSIPFSNTYLMSDKSMTRWLSYAEPNIPGTPSKRQGEEVLDGDPCFYLDSEGNLVDEPCPYYATSN
ncbi:hypothetical protein BGX26_007941 [Mortierella sp. AD094]|nr:hypothetical protein BGX26_007941 [Mortierella sp. AD094]